MSGKICGDSLVLTFSNFETKYMFLYLCIKFQDPGMTGIYGWGLIFCSHRLTKKKKCGQFYGMKYDLALKPLLSQQISIQQDAWFHIGSNLINLN